MATKRNIPTKVIASALTQATIHKPTGYAIVTIISGKRYYWCRSQQTFSNFFDATVFTKNERKAYTMPKTPNQGTPPIWVTVLHGMGPTPYPALTELKSTS